MTVKESANLLFDGSRPLNAWNYNLVPATTREDLRQPWVIDDELCTLEILKLATKMDVQSRELGEPVIHSARQLRCHPHDDHRPFQSEEIHYIILESQESSAASRYYRSKNCMTGGAFVGPGAIPWRDGTTNIPRRAIPRKRYTLEGVLSSIMEDMPHTDKQMRKMTSVEDPPETA